MPALSPYITKTLYGSSSQPFCPNAPWVIHSAATTPAYLLGWFLRSLFRSWSSALAYERIADGEC